MLSQKSNANGIVSIWCFNRVVEYLSDDRFVGLSFRLSSKFCAIHLSLNTAMSNYCIVAGCSYRQVAGHVLENLERDALLMQDRYQRHA